MSKTTNLQLFKHDEPLETNENDFDIDEALNDNWDILDAFAGQVDTRLETLENDLDEISTNLDALETNIETLQSNVTSLQTDNETNKQNIQDLQSEQETQNTAIENNTEELELLKNNLPDPITTEESEEITVQNAMNYYGSLDVSGNSTQATRSGKNKLKISDVAETTNGNGITYSVKDGVITLNGTSTRPHYINFKSDAIDLPANTYTMSSKVISGSYSGVAGKQLNDDTNSNILNGNYMQDTATVEIAEDKTGVYLSLYIGGTVVLNNYKLEIQLEEGTEATEIEKYGVMPSPDYPSEIKNCGDNINRFDKSTIKTGYYLDSAGAEVANTNYAITDYIEVEENENYTYQGLNITASFGAKGAYYNSSKEFVSPLDLNAENTTILIPENVKYVKFTIRTTNNNQDTFKIEKGSIATPYSAYNCGSVDIKVENANKYVPFETELVNRGVTTNFYLSGNIKLNGTATGSGGRDTTKNVSTKNVLKAGQPYTMYVEVVSGTGETGNIYLNRVDNNAGLRYCKEGEVKTFTQNEDVEVYWGINVIQGNAYDNLMLRFGLFEGTYTYEEIRKKFVIHEEQIIPFPLKEGQLLHAGDYLASDGVHHVKQTCVFDGTENVLSGYLDETIDSFRIVTSGKYNQMLGYQTDDKCSHFKNLGHTPAWGRQANTFALSSEGYLYIFFEKNKITSETEAKNWIAEQYNNGTPLTAEGTLEEEHIEPYTEEQQAVYNELQRLILYKGYNYITCIDETKCKMKLTYRPDNNSKIKSLEERVAALESEATA